MKNQTISNQSKTYGPKFFTEKGETFSIKAFVHHDDRCKNGHNTFSITGEINSHGREVAGGCLHDEIAKHFPELVPFIKWHLCATDGPMHYVANTVHHAGDRDCWGLRKGEFRQHTSRGEYQNGGIAGVPNWVLKLPEKRDIYSVEKPTPVALEWQPYGKTGEGKERDLNAARSCAVWPDATDSELTDPGLGARLLARLPALLAEFRTAVESLGFQF